MNNYTLKIGFNILLFLLVILSGIFLSKNGRPLNSTIFTIHKIVSITAIIYCSIFIVNSLKVVNLNHQITVCIILSTLFVVLEIVTGAILCFETTINSTLKILHKIMPALIFIFVGITLYLLASTEN